MQYWNMSYKFYMLNNMALLFLLHIQKYIRVTTYML